MLIFIITFFLLTLGLLSYSRSLRYTVRLRSFFFNVGFSLYKLTICFCCLSQVLVCLVLFVFQVLLCKNQGFGVNLRLGPC